MGFLLTFTAFLLLMILAIPSAILGSVFSFIGRQFNYFWMDVAIGLDCFGNVICQHLFNFCLIKKAGYRFGNIKETISSVLGKNYVESVRLAGLKYSYKKEKISFKSWMCFFGSIHNRIVWLKILRKEGVLTRVGIFFCNFLNAMDKNHVQDSIDNIV